MGFLKVKNNSFSTNDILVIAQRRFDESFSIRDSTTNVLDQFLPAGHNPYEKDNRKTVQRIEECIILYIRENLHELIIGISSQHDDIYSFSNARYCA